VCGGLTIPGVAGRAGVRSPDGRMDESSASCHVAVTTFLQPASRTWWSAPTRASTWSRHRALEHWTRALSSLPPGAQLRVGNPSPARGNQPQDRAHRRRPVLEAIRRHVDARPGATTSSCSRLEKRSSTATSAARNSSNAPRRAREQPESVPANSRRDCSAPPHHLHAIAGRCRRSTPVRPCRGHH